MKINTKYGIKEVKKVTNGYEKIFETIDGYIFFESQVTIIKATKKVRINMTKKEYVEKVIKRIQKNKSTLNYVINKKELSDILKEFNNCNFLKTVIKDNTLFIKYNNNVNILRLNII